MDAQAIGSISAAVVTLTQLVKWMRLVSDQRGPLAVLGWSAIAEVLWIVSHPPFLATMLFDYFVTWLVVSAAAAGIYGFTRSGPSALTATTDPPPGAGAEPTIQVKDLKDIIREALKRDLEPQAGDRVGGP